MSDKEPVRDHFTQGEEGLYTHDTAKRRATKAAKTEAPDHPGPSDSTPEVPAPPAEE